MAPRRQRRAHAAHLGHAAQDTAAVKLVCWRAQAQRETPRFRSNPKRSLSVLRRAVNPVRWRCVQTTRELRRRNLAPTLQNCKASIK
jgi:hypothetical protein